MSIPKPTLGEPLPSGVFDKEGQENCKSLLEALIRPAEIAAVRNFESSRTGAERQERRKDVIALRLVGYLLIHHNLFSPEARVPMENAIASCNMGADDVDTRTRLCELGRFYLNHLIRPSELHVLIKYHHIDNTSI